MAFDILISPATAALHKSVYHLRSRMRHALLALSALVAFVVVFAQPAIPQDPAYHVLADERPLLGVPNGLNVLSSAAFAVVALFGFVALRRARDRFADSRERWPYIALFAGVVLTAFGSAWYHLAPDNARLVWDRLPMTIGFMGLLAALLSERVSPRLGRVLLVPLLLLGAFSVLHWHRTETAGAGDLRLYGFVQFGSLLLVALMLMLYRGRYGGTAWLTAGLALYAGAKIFEIADAEILARGGIVSGHTVKHLAAAAGVACVAAMLWRRADGGRRGGQRSVVANHRL